MSEIRNYAFYGEDAEAPREDLLHCETLHARGIIHNWRFRPHRHHGMHQFFWVGAGAGTASIDGTEHRLGPMTALSLPPMSVHGFVFEPGIEGWVVTIPNAHLERILANSDMVMSRLRHPAIFVARESGESLFSAIAREFARFSRERDLALTSLTGLLAVWFAREIADPPNAAPAGGDRGQELVARFLRKVEAEFAAHLPVARHAAALGVTPTHLSRVCRALTGRPASQLIQDRLALEARRRLIYTPHAVSEIAYALGFEDPAHFSKFFRKQTGQSPSAFRAAMGDRVAVGR